MQLSGCSTADMPYGLTTYTVRFRGTRSRHSARDQHRNSNLQDQDWDDKETALKLQDCVKTKTSLDISHVGILHSIHVSFIQPLVHFWHFTPQTQTLSHSKPTMPSHVGIFTSSINCSPSTDIHVGLYHSAILPCRNKIGRHGWLETTVCPQKSQLLFSIASSSSCN